MSADPIILNVTDGDIGRAILPCTTASEDELHSIVFDVSRSWVDLYIGTTSGGDEISEAAFNRSALRLAPGRYVISFTPGASPFYLTAERNREGVTAIENLEFVTDSILAFTTPYAEADLGELRLAQSRDLKWICHPRHAPRLLVRYSNASWGLAYWQPENGPFLSTNDSEITLTPSELRGANVTITASEDLFKSEHVGRLLRLTHAGQHETASLTGADQFSDPIRVSGVEDARIFTASISGTFSATVTLQRSVGDDVNWQDVQTLAAGSHQIDDEFDNSVIYYRLGVKSGDYTSGTVEVSLLYSSGETTGICRIVTVSAADQLNVDVIEPFGAIVATRTWAEGAWSNLTSWPGAVDLFDGRLWLGAALTLHASVADDFSSFELTADDSGAIQRSLATGDASPIRWIKGALRLQIGTDAGSAPIDAVRIGDSLSLQVRSNAFDEPLTPSNMTVREASAKIVFVDASAARLQRLSYNVDTNSFASDDLNRLHADIGFLGGGFVDLTFQQRPFPRCWAPRADGQLPCLTLSEQEQVVGWSRIVLGAQSVSGEAIVKSAAATPGVNTGETDQDFVHIIVQRELNEETVICHERIERERWIDVTDACFLESAVRYEGDPASYFWGLDHLLGEDVYVWGDGSQWGPFEVVALSTLDASFVSGEIGIYLGAENEVSDAWIGLEMRSRYLSGKTPYGAQAGTAVGEAKRIDHVTMLFHKTGLGGVFVGVVDGSKADPFEDADLQCALDLAEGFAVDDPTELFSGELELTIDSETLRDPRLAIEIRGCAPAAILGYVLNMGTTERTG